MDTLEQQVHRAALEQQKRDQEELEARGQWADGKAIRRALLGVWTVQAWLKRRGLPAGEPVVGPLPQHPSMGWVNQQLQVLIPAWPRSSATYRPFGQRSGGPEQFSPTEFSKSE
ncbi:hypothetical protein Dxin01_00834 [Deinococcus xinjiangensis]|uniref:Transposase n=1 Tax=Deinococcus xinjiangensis TaxID=457454 RepID=A0ABP9V745_9DEIO